MSCYVVGTGSHLPGGPVPNERIGEYLGRLEGEESISRLVLRACGIRSRHYAQDERQHATCDVYGLATAAVRACMAEAAVAELAAQPTLLCGGTTFAPMSAPGVASIVHSRLAEGCERWRRPVEISSHAGVCTSAAAALIHAVDGVASGRHRAAVAFGVEHASEVLKSSAIRPVDDRHEHAGPVTHSRYFHSVFLRFMLSDGAGAVLLSDSPGRPRAEAARAFGSPVAEAAKAFGGQDLSWRVDWTFSRSMAFERPLCMWLDNRTALLSQDVSILNEHLMPATEAFLREAFAARGLDINAFDTLLVHLSSMAFRRPMQECVSRLAGGREPPAVWTNLQTAGNTGSASIYVMLDEFTRTQAVRPGQRILLYIPESGQFNFVLVALTAVGPQA